MYSRLDSRQPRLTEMLDEDVDQDPHLAGGKHTRRAHGDGFPSVA